MAPRTVPERSERPACAACWRKPQFAYHVPDSVWDAVVKPGPYNIPGRGLTTSAWICLQCFDRRARTRGIEYWSDLVVFGHDAWMVTSYVRTPEYQEKLAERRGY